MKSFLGSQQLAKCNFCLNWYDITNQHYSALTDLYVCPACFDRTRKGSHFRVVQPKSMNVYEVQLRKCMGMEFEVLRGVGGELLELVDKWEREQGEQQGGTTERFKGFISQLMTFENQTLNQLQPLRQTINKIYKSQLSRIEKIWSETLQQVDSIGGQVIQYRKSVTQQLKKQICDLDLSEQRFTALKTQINEKLKNYTVERLKEICREAPERMFRTGFRIVQEVPEGMLTERVGNKGKGGNSESEYFTNSGHRREASVLKFKEKKSSWRSNQKENGPNSGGYLTERSTSPFLKSPMRQNKFTAMTIRQSRKDTTSVESFANQSDDQRKQQTKSQIRDLLKSKSQLPSYKPNQHLIQSPHLLLYPQIIMKQTIFEALELTFTSTHLIQLIAYNTQQLDFQCYLQMLRPRFQPQLQVIKFVKVGLTDDHLNMLLSFVRHAQNLECLVVTNNVLTDGCLEMLCRYFNTERPVRSLYLGRNYIQPLRGRARIQELRHLGVNVFI